MGAFSPLPSRALLLCVGLLLAVVAGGWPSESRPDAGTEWASPRGGGPTLEGPERVAVQLADRLARGGGSLSLSLVQPRSGAGATPGAIFLCAFSSFRSAAHCVMAHGPEIPWVLSLSVCLQL